MDKQIFYSYINSKISKKVKNNLLLQFIYAALIILIFLLLYKLPKSEIYNAVTAFIVIDISNTERRNLKKKDRFYFYNSISTISKALIYGFTAPLIYIIFLGNAFGIAYTLVCNIGDEGKLKGIKIVLTILNIIPSIIVEFILYIIYIFRNRKLAIDFKGDYLFNCFFRPMLNVDIMAAYVESVNFYYCFSDKSTSYIKSYGEYSNKIDSICIKDYLKLLYGISILFFILFFIGVRLFIG